MPFAENAEFRVAAPLCCPDSPPEALRPKSTWKDPAAHDAKAKVLVGLVHKNLEASGGVNPEGVADRPRLQAFDG